MAAQGSIFWKIPRWKYISADVIWGTNMKSEREKGGKYSRNRNKGEERMKGERKRENGKLKGKIKKFNFRTKI
jgi:hypothetical protein